MKIAVLGAGAMGSVFGARLAMGGAEVTLLDVNDAHLAAIKENGLSVDLDGVQHSVSLLAMRPEQFAGSVDVVLLFTKIFHTEAALSAVSDALGNAYVLSLQNGIGNAERIATRVVPEKILLGMTMTPAEFVNPGQVASHGPAETAFYALDGQKRPILEDLVHAMEQGGVAAKADPNIQAAIWEKAAFNCAMNALAALTGATPGAIGHAENGRALASRVAAEAIAVAEATGVAADMAKVEALLSHAYDHHQLHEPSMLQDIKAGRRTEVDALNGAVASKGAEKGLDVSTNAVLTDLIKLAETAAVYRQNSRSFVCYDSPGLFNENTSVTAE
jgi:2-dehydropantoate 2-reductase